MIRCINEEGLDLVQRWEGCKLSVYRDARGIFTIGFGHTKGVTADTAPCTYGQAIGWLDEDLEEAEVAVDRMIRVPISDNQFSALVSLVFNIGVGNFMSSTLRALINRNDLLGAADQFLRWNRCDGKILAGLTERRKEERALFLKPVIVKKG